MSAYRSLCCAIAALAGVVLLALPVTMTSVVSVLAATALIMGGSGDPDPVEPYVSGVANNYVAPFFPAPLTAVGIHTAEDFWPVSGIASLTFDQSVAQGVTDLDTAIAVHPGPLIIVGYSESTRIATIKKRKLIEANGDDFSAYPDLSFVLVANVAKGNGGILERFQGRSIGILGVTFDGATPTNSPLNPNNAEDHALDTIDINYIHDGFADFPIYPLNLLAVANALAGIAYLHYTYSNLNEPPLITQGTNGDTRYYVIDNGILPILRPLEDLGVPRPLLLAVDAPLRVMVEAGYRRDINPGVPTLAYLVPVNNRISLIANLIKSIPVGIDDGLQAAGLPRALGTTSPGPYGVGGEDANLVGHPPGFLPLGQPSSGASLGQPSPGASLGQSASGASATPLTPTNSVAAPAATGLPGSTSVGSNVTPTHSARGPMSRLNAVDEMMAPVATPSETAEVSSSAPADRPKPVRPKVRGPIASKPTKPASIRPADDRPVRQVVTAPTGKRSESAANAGPSSLRAGDNSVGVKGNDAG